MSSRPTNLAQVWLTQTELDALLRAGGKLGTAVSPALWEIIAPILKSARDRLAADTDSRRDVGGL